MAFKEQERYKKAHVKRELGFSQILEFILLEGGIRDYTSDLLLEFFILYPFYFHTMT